jgi:hypothetical protein
MCTFMYSKNQLAAFVVQTSLSHTDVPIYLDVHIYIYSKNQLVAFVVQNVYYCKTLPTDIYIRACNPYIDTHFYN